MDSCRFCFANGKMRDAICAEGETVYLAVTGNEPMTEGHCMIITKNHYASLPCCDEDVAAEILNWRRKLSSMWKLDDKVRYIYIKSVQISYKDNKCSDLALLNSRS